MNVQQITQQMQQILEKLDNIQITEMAQKQGQDAEFVYYTLDNEYISHYPHVHICVPNQNKRWDGKPLHSGHPLKTVASVRLLNTKTYAPDDIIFEEIKDPKIDTKKYRKIIADWLNSTISGLKYNNKQGNALKCLHDYLNSNQTKHDDYDILLD